MKLTKRAFREWLESKHPRTVVGSRRDCERCPLARFVGPKTLVGDHDYDIPEKCGIPLPRWAEQFVRAIDGPRWPRRGGTITASAALRILEKC